MVRAQRRRQSRVSAHKTTVLPGGISSPTFLFCLCGRRKRPSCHRPPLQRGGLEICAADPRYTSSVASSGRISPRKCRDMRGRPSIYVFSGIIRAHISGMRLLKYRVLQKIDVRGPHFSEGTTNKVISHSAVSQRIMKSRCSRSVVRRCDPGWCSGSFTPPADPSLRLRLRSG